MPSNNDASKKLCVVSGQLEKSENINLGLDYLVCVCLSMADHGQLNRSQLVSEILFE